jgi:3-oxoacyl-[acyl-carrier protein] reductase
VSNGLRPGLAGFAKTLAAELGPRGIRVVGLLPTRIDTDRVR